MLVNSLVKSRNTASWWWFVVVRWRAVDIFQTSALFDKCTLQNNPVLSVTICHLAKYTLKQECERMRVKTFSCDRDYDYGAIYALLIATDLTESKTRRIWKDELICGEICGWRRQKCSIDVRISQSKWGKSRREWKVDILPTLNSHQIVTNTGYGLHVCTMK